MPIDRSTSRLSSAISGAYSRRAKRLFIMQTARGLVRKSLNPPLARGVDPLSLQFPQVFSAWDDAWTLGGRGDCDEHAMQLLAFALRAGVDSRVLRLMFDEVAPHLSLAFVGGGGAIWVADSMFPVRGRYSHVSVRVWDGVGEIVKI